MQKWKNTITVYVQAKHVYKIICKEQSKIIYPCLCAGMRFFVNAKRGGGSIPDLPIESSVVDRFFFLFAWNWSWVMAPCRALRFAIMRLFSYCTVLHSWKTSYIIIYMPYVYVCGHQCIFHHPSCKFSNTCAPMRLSFAKEKASSLLFKANSK